MISFHYRFSGYGFYTKLFLTPAFENFLNNFHFSLKGYVFPAIRHERTFVMNPVHFTGINSSLITVGRARKKGPCKVQSIQHDGDYHVFTIMCCGVQGTTSMLLFRTGLFIAYVGCMMPGELTECGR